MEWRRNVPAELRRTWMGGDAYVHGDGVRPVSPPTDRAEPSLVAAFAGHRAALLRYLRARGAADDAEDIVQELWLKLPAAGADPVTDPLGYLYRMAHNLMLDRRRAALRRERREKTYHSDVKPLGEGSDPIAPDRTLIARERLARVDRALATLGPKTDQIFRRHRVEGVPQRIIAEELGVTLSAVEKHLQKAYRAVAAAQRSFLAEDRGAEVKGIEDMGVDDG